MTVIFIEKDWRAYASTSDTSLCSSLFSAKEGFLRRMPLIIVDRNDQLVGTLSNGDIKKAITSGKISNLSSIPVGDICNRRPIFARETDKEETIASYLTKDVRLVPICSSGKRVIAIAYSDEPNFIIGTTTIKQQGLPYIIGEIGVNHNGNISTAKLLIKHASQLGLNAVKFQLRGPRLYSTDPPETLDLSDQYIRSQLDRIKLKPKEELTLIDYANESGLDVIVSPFDTGSAHLCIQLYKDNIIKAVKVPSCELTNTPMLSYLADTGIPIILSTGMSYEHEIINAIALFPNKSRLSLLHCNSTYPAPTDDLNLAYINRLKHISGCIVGFSSHHIQHIVPLTAFLLGAQILEFHITLDTTADGTDHKASLDIQETKQLLQQIDISYRSVGNSMPRFPTQGELINRSTLSKSLCYNKDLKAGTILSRSDFELRSPGSGYSFDEINDIVGSTLIKDIREGLLVRQEHLLNHAQPAIPIAAIPEHLHSALGRVGIPVRYHDIKELHQRFSFKSYEFHLGSADLSIHHDKVYDIVNDLSLEIDYLTFHCIEQYDDGFIVDLASLDAAVVNESIQRLNKLLAHCRSVYPIFPRVKDKKLVLNLGGFSRSYRLGRQVVESMYSRLSDSLKQLSDVNNDFIILPQTMPPFPWHQGGTAFHNLMVNIDSILFFHETTDLPICLDVSHTLMACLHNNEDWKNVLLTLLPITGHIHLADARKPAEEGVQLGEGELDIHEFVSALLQSTYRSDVILEIWQGHHRNGEGFKRAFDFYKRTFDAIQ
jgi:sialic acid synthase SpsE